MIVAVPHSQRAVAGGLRAPIHDDVAFTRRKVSGGTRSDLGRDCRDTFLALAKTCAKLDISFWAYLGVRLAVPDAAIIPPLPQLVLARPRAL
jgi:hypothetical protein